MMNMGFMLNHKLQGICKIVLTHKYLVLGNVIRIFELDNDNYIDKDDPLIGILVAAAFTIQTKFYII